VPRRLIEARPVKNSDDQTDPEKQRSPRGRIPSLHGDVTVRQGEALPTADPAFPIIHAVLDLVPISGWSFARIDAKSEFATCFGSYPNSDGPAWVGNERKLQREQSPAGPRIAATLGPLDGFACGITLIFADSRTDLALLALLRTSELGPFTSSEIRILTFALDALSDRLSASRLDAAASSRATNPSRAEESDGSASGAFYVLDGDFHITMAWTPDDQRLLAPAGVATHAAERLPHLLEETVRELTRDWSADTKTPGIAHPVPFLVVRTQPMAGSAGQFIGVWIDRFRPPNSLSSAAHRFRISPRELQVLALLLDGNHLDQIAAQLHITSSTVQDHIKRMLDKTESRNRSELIARVLGWESPPGAPHV
jgi:DNA-binding CsgD family transcriptional regulator